VLAVVSLRHVSRVLISIHMPPSISSASLSPCFACLANVCALQVIVTSSGREERQLWSMGKKVVDGGAAADAHDV